MTEIEIKDYHTKIQEMQLRNDCINLFEYLIQFKEKYHDNWEYHFLIGKLSLKCEFAELAEKHLWQAIELNNKSITIICRDLSIYSIENYQNILNLCRKIHSKFPNHHQPLIEASYIFMQINDLEMAIKFLQMAKSLNPKNIIIYLNLGHCFLYLNRLQESMENYKFAQIIAPDNINSFCNIASVYYAIGDYVLANKHYEYRLQLPLYSKFLNEYNINISQQIDLSNESSKKILIIYEGGIGDMLAMMRYYPILQRAKYEIYLGIFHIKNDKIWQYCPCIKKIITNKQEFEAINFDAQIFCMSLPFYLQANFDNIPAPEINFKSTFFVNEKFQNQKLKIGFSWRGGAINPLRAINLEYILNIFPAELQLFCFQIEFTKEEEELMNKRGNITILKPQITDWADTAGFLEQMDLLITIDSGIAHLASALGFKNKLWILLPFFAGWYWYCTKTNYPPWHPDARTFRQNKFNDWGNVIDDVRTELNKFLEDWAP